jgi:hypothetical protein
MEKKIYTGAYLLQYLNGEGQFGAVDATYNVSDKSEKARVLLRKKDLKKLLIDDDSVSFEISLEQLEIISSTSRSVFENVNLMKSLSKRDKLKENAFFLDDSETL